MFGANEKIGKVQKKGCAVVWQFQISDVAPCNGFLRRENLYLLNKILKNKV